MMNMPSLHARHTAPLSIPSGCRLDSILRRVPPPPMGQGRTLTEVVDERRRAAETFSTRTPRRQILPEFREGENAHDGSRGRISVPAGVVSGVSGDAPQFRAMPQFSREVAMPSPVLQSVGLAGSRGGEDDMRLRKVTA